MPTKKSDAIHYNCNHCMVGVTEAKHATHMKILDAVMAAEVPGYEDLFVHERGHIQSFDPDGAVVVCDSCFVIELSDNLESAPQF